MKRIISLPLIALLIMTIAVSCDKDDNNNTIGTTMQQGKWKITLFSESGVNQTSNFTNYEFTFSSGGTVTATKAGLDVNGTWSSNNDDSREKLIMTFGVNPLDELSEDWHVLEESSTKVRLEHVSGGGGGTDLLTFEKL